MGADIVSEHLHELNNGSRLISSHLISPHSLLCRANEMGVYYAAPFSSFSSCRLSPVIIPAE